MTKPVPKDENILGYECRFAVYCPPPEGERSDLHVVKEIVHMRDGTTRPNLRLVKDYKRPFWVTKKGLQNHQDKKEWEKIENVNKFETTQSEIIRNAAKALGMPWFNENQRDPMRKLSASPYLYGTDILSTALIKRQYQDRFPDLLTPYTSAAFDTEKDVINGTDEINMATLSFGSKVFTAVQKSFVEGYSDVIPRLQVLFKQYLGAMEGKDKKGDPVVVDFIEKRKLEWEIIIVDDEVDIIQECFKRAHNWQPDFVAIWNIDFDMPMMTRALQKKGIDPKDVFSDPKIPPAYRHFRYKKGPNKKVTASGKAMPIKPPAQWHTVFCPSSFYFIDAMCAYRHIRTGNAEEPSYALDAILDKHLGMRKLKFEQANGLSGIEWHQFMQSKYPLEYIIYNVFDCISMEVLDEETNDLRLTFPLFSGCSDFENFKSQPRRTADNLHFFCLQNGRVIGSTSGEMASDLDKITLGLDGWIVTLPAHLVMDNGLKIVEENPELSTNIRSHVGDLDVSASYPNGGCVFNISKETTHKELCKINGVSEFMQRMQGINLSAGHTNAVEFCTGMYGLPGMETLLKAFQHHLNPHETLVIPERPTMYLPEIIRHESVDIDENEGLNLGEEGID